PAYFAVRLRGNSGNLAARIPSIALATDPALRVYRALPFNAVLTKGAASGRMAYLGVNSAIALAVALSAAGLFALMSVAVKRRTREIGIRMALGANARGVLRALFARAAAQLAGGIVIGNALVFGVRKLLGSTSDLSFVALSMLAISVLMVLVGVA